MIACLPLQPLFIGLYIALGLCAPLLVFLVVATVRDRWRPRSHQPRMVDLTTPSGRTRLPR